MEDSFKHGQEGVNAFTGLSKESPLYIQSRWSRLGPVIMDQPLALMSGQNFIECAVGLIIWIQSKGFSHGEAKTLWCLLVTGMFACHLFIIIFYKVC